MDFRLQDKLNMIKVVQKRLTNLNLNLDNYKKDKMKINK